MHKQTPFIYRLFHLACQLQYLHSMRTQRTLGREVKLEGIGLHTGEHSAMRLKPAPQDSGIVFYRKDKDAYIKASLNSVCETTYATTLGTNGTNVKTVEHLLAALSGLGIDNLEIRLDGPEIPIMDGSSKKFADSIAEAGIADQTSRREHMRIIRPFTFRDGEAEFTALPYQGRLITYQISYAHKLLGTQQMTFEMEEDAFRHQIAPARTFGFLKDVQYLRANGLAKGGSLENAVLLSETGIVNSTGLRFRDEFLRHKLLDFIGDLSLIGFPVIGHLIARKSGHSSNLKFAKALLAASDCWEISSDGFIEGAKANFKYA